MSVVCITDFSPVVEGNSFSINKLHADAFEANHISFPNVFHMCPFRAHPNIMFYRMLMLLPLWVVTAVAEPSTVIFRKLEKLAANGSVLYFAAHPDDENTALLYYMSHEMKLDTAYLSLTRGDGGQNRIGTQLGTELGMIRTQELLGARTWDWSRQFFSSAVDFGYSKTVNDTLNHWDEEQVLEDAVYIIRKYRPDIIITRFHPEAGETHGHHTASARIALKAFEMAADPSCFPDQLVEVSVHQTRQICWDSYRNEASDAVNEVFDLSLSSYDALFGGSVMEFSRQALANNKSQGTVFATNRRNGSVRLRWLAGEKFDQFSIQQLSDGKHLSNERKALKSKLDLLLDQFDFEEPFSSFVGLIELKSVLESWQPSTLKDQKLAQLNTLLSDLLGFFFQVKADKKTVVPGETATVNIEWVNRSPFKIEVKSIQFSGFSAKHYPEREYWDHYRIDQALDINEPLTKELQLHIPDTVEYSQPYWLNHAGSAGDMFHIENGRLRWEPDNPNPVTATAIVQIDGHELNLSVPVIHQDVDLYAGEINTPIAVVPPVSVRFSGTRMLFSGPSPQPLTIELSAQKALTGELLLEIDDGWKISEYDALLTLKEGEIKAVNVWIEPPYDHPSQRPLKESFLKARFMTVGGEYNQEIRTIDYPHIETQTWLTVSQLPLSQFELNTVSAQSIAYVQGAGDRIPEILRKVGLKVDEIAVSDLLNLDLSSYSAVVFGIRVVDVHPEVLNASAVLEDYVRKGGVWLMQYNTVGRNHATMPTPAPMTLSRDRVSDELAAVTILSPEHPLMVFPNRISSADFDDWVQERGLYFASEWDSQFTPLLSSHDPDESPSQGGLLVAEFGEGRFVYTGYSFFRQLPAGVPGAIRLFINLISNPGEKKP